MRLHFIPLLLLASVTAAQAQHGSAASQMAGRATANAGQVRDATSGGVTSLYVLQEPQPQGSPANSPENKQPDGAPDTNPQPLQNSALTNSFTNPAMRGLPASFPPQPPSPLRTQVPAFGTTGVPAFHAGR